jgi:hypothetical protein
VVAAVFEEGLEIGLRYQYLATVPSGHQPHLEPGVEEDQGLTRTSKNG